MHRTILLFATILFGLQIISAQEITTFDVATRYKVSSSAENKYTSRFISKAEKYDNTNRRVRKEYKKIYENRAEYFKTLNSHFLLMDKVDLVAKLQSILDYIVAKNSQLKKNHFKIFINRSPIPNAGNLGEGIIFFNIGLLTQLDNIDEIAFVLCHEMAHDSKEHVYEMTKSMAKYHKKSKAYKDLKKASKKTYGSYSAQVELLKKLTALETLHSRERELEADNLGAKYYINAGFKKKYIFTLLEKLDYSDELIYDTELDIISALSTKSYTIKEQYLSAANDYDGWDKMDDLYIVPDSLKTHPNCDVRIQTLSNKNLIDNNNNDFSFPNFNQFKQKLIYEYLHTLLENDNIGTALYLATCAKNAGDKSPFINAVITFSFYDLYHAIKNQQFSNKVAFPDKEYSKGYNQFLEFLQAQNSRRFLKMADGFFNDYLASAPTFQFRKAITAYKKFVTKDIYPKKKFKNYYYKNLFTLKKD